MHLNPVRNGLASRPEGWRWSSYSNFALDKDTVACRPIEIRSGPRSRILSRMRKAHDTKSVSWLPARIASRREHTIQSPAPHPLCPVHVNLQLTIDSRTTNHRDTEEDFFLPFSVPLRLRGETLWHRRCIRRSDTGRAREIPPAPNPARPVIAAGFCPARVGSRDEAFAGALRMHKRLEARTPLG